MQDLRALLGIQKNCKKALKDWFEYGGLTTCVYKEEVKGEIKEEEKEEEEEEEEE